MDAALGGTSSETVENVHRVADQWRSDFADLLPAFSLALALRQAIATRQQPCGEESLLWPGLASNPLARLHIIIVDDDGVKGKGFAALKVNFSVIPRCTFRKLVELEF